MENNMREKLFVFNTGITLLVMAISGPIILISTAFLLSQPSAMDLRRYISAQSYISKHTFPTTNSLMNFVHKNYLGRHYDKAALNIYKVNVYGHTDCAQLVVHHPFANPVYDSIKLFNCNGNPLNKVATH
jgi:hypothetical protein